MGRDIHRMEELLVLTEVGKGDRRRVEITDDVVVRLGVDVNEARNRRCLRVEVQAAAAFQS
jgi:hypothetical protein